MRQISSAVLGAILLSAAVADSGVVESPDEVLRTLITAEPFLFSIFGNSHPELTSVRRADALAEADGIRHAVVVFQPVGVRENHNRSLGEKFCHATLIRPEHKILEQKVREWTTDDVLYRKVYRRTGASVHMRLLRDAVLPAPEGWRVHLCSVSLEDITVVDPQVDEPLVLQSIYDLGKEMLSDNRHDEALKYLEDLEDKPEHAMNAALLIAVIYRGMDTGLADLYRKNYVDVEVATDLEAVEIYEQTFPPLIWQDLMNLDRVLGQGERVD